MDVMWEFREITCFHATTGGNGRRIGSKLFRPLERGCISLRSAPSQGRFGKGCHRIPAHTRASVGEGVEK